MISPWKVTFYFFVNIQIKLETKKKKIVNRCTYIQRAHDYYYTWRFIQKTTNVKKCSITIFSHSNSSRMNRFITIENVERGR